MNRGIYGGIADTLLTSEELCELLTDRELYEGKETAVNGRVFGPALFSSDNRAVVYAGMTIKRAVYPTEESDKKYGERPVMSDWFSYNGLTADELRAACRDEGLEIGFIGPVTGKRLSANGDDSVYMFPCIVKR